MELVTVFRKSFCEAGSKVFLQQKTLPKRKISGYLHSEKILRNDSGTSILLLSKSVRKTRPKFGFFEKNHGTLQCTQCHTVQDGPGALLFGDPTCSADWTIDIRVWHSRENVLQYFSNYPGLLWCQWSEDALNTLRLLFVFLKNITFSTIY